MKTTKPKLNLCLALILNVCAFISSESAWADNALPPLVFLADTQPIYMDPPIQTNWSDIKVPLYRDSGTAAPLDAKWIRIRTETNSWSEENIVALVNPETGNSWVGSLGWGEQYFFLETKTNIICGGVISLASELGASHGGENEFNGAAASVIVQWYYSYIPNLKRRNTATAAVKELTDEIKKYGSWRKTWQKLYFPKFLQQKEYTSLPVSKRGENGVNPWLFLPTQNGGFPTITYIQFKDGTLYLDLKGPDGVHPTGANGVHTARVWIDVKTLKVTKIIQDPKTQKLKFTP